MSSVLLTPDHLRQAVEQVGNRAADLDEPAFVFDVETRPGVGVEIDYTVKDAFKDAALDWKTNDVYWLSLATTGCAYTIPMGHPNGEQVGWKTAPLRPGTKSTKRKVPDFAPPPEQMLPSDVFDIVKPLFFDTSLRKIAHNAPFDVLSVGKYYGEPPKPPYADTIVMGQLLNENRPLDLGYLTKTELRYTYEKLGKTLLTESFSRASSYSYLDSKTDWLLFRRFLPRLATDDLLDYWWFECDVTEVVVDMEWIGAPVIGNEVVDLDVFLLGEMDRLEAELYSEAGKRFDLTRPVDKGWFIYTHCGHTPRVFTPKKKEPSLKAEVLAAYASDKRVATLLEWESLAKLHSTYVLNYKKYEHKGRIHAKFNQAGTVTGRFSCSAPNLQNVPTARTEVGKRIRNLFWAGSPDYTLVVGDFSQIELRVMAHYSGDPTMCAAFERGDDIHQASADTLGCERNIAKNINFAIPFGAGYRKVATMGGGKFSIATAKKFYEKHQEDFPLVWAFVRKTRADCRKYSPHEVRTILGRKRRLPRIVLAKDPDESKRELGAYAERQAVNTKVQGSAADLIKMAMVRLHDGLDEDMHIIMQVHDELVVITPKNKVDRCIEIMHEAMEGPAMQILRVPVAANIAAADRWGEAK